MFCYPGIDARLCKIRLRVSGFQYQVARLLSSRADLRRSRGSHHPGEHGCDEFGQEGAVGVLQALVMVEDLHGLRI